MNVRAEVKAKTLRCAVYTRKSSEEGLEQAFNSLHAQRHACEAYISSQAGEGWTLLPGEYDDGGISGGTMDRPALKRLLAEIKQGLVDVVVVYKVDRLTRSLGDFARIVEIFDAAGASFVSVTQAFNTTNSMGRLTLNVLLSFAQFEREVTGERIRDKIAMSKAKGIWMGGTLSLGYDLADRKLITNPAEAQTVRQIYKRYLRLGSVNLLRQELAAKGILSKAWVARNGQAQGGCVIGRGGLYHMLSNRLYLGEITHKDQSYRGEHPAIIDAKLFEAVQRKLKTNRVARGARSTAKTTSPLTGLIYDAQGQPMSPTFAYGKSGKVYRYYVAQALQQGERADATGGTAAAADLIQRVAAKALEAYLIAQLRRIADQPDLQLDALAPLLCRLELRRTETHLVLNADALFQLDHPQLAFEDLQGRLTCGERAVIEPSQPPAIRISLSVRMQLRGGRTSVTTPGADPGPVSRSDHGLIDAIKSAHAELAALNASPLTPTRALAHGQAPVTRHRRQVARLAFLAPDLQQMILEGRQPAALSLRALLKTELPLAWADQRAWFAQMRVGQGA